MLIVALASELALSGVGTWQRAMADLAQKFRLMGQLVNSARAVGRWVARGPTHQMRNILI